VEFNGAENNVSVYKENGKTITVTREVCEDRSMDFSMLIDALYRLVESEEEVSPSD
jgi:helix-turn-helix protein